MEFPLYIMYEIQYKNEIDKEAFKDFIHKVFLMSFDNDKLKHSIMTTPIYIGLPDELTTTEFLNNIYANLNLTGEEGVYKMYQEMKKYDDVIRDEKNTTNYVKNLSENAEEIFKKCKFSNLQQNCYEVNNFFGLLIIL